MGGLVGRGEGSDVIGVDCTHVCLDGLAGVLVRAHGAQQQATCSSPCHAEDGRECHGHAGERLDGVGHDGRVRISDRGAREREPAAGGDSEDKGCVE